MTVHTEPSADDDVPLISNRFLYRLTAIIALLAAVTVAISLAGRWYGEHMALGGHTASPEIFSVQIGTDTIALAANTIRNREQRRSGPTERVDLYLTWPGLEGYRDDLKAQFNSITGPGHLLFLQLSQGTMTRDMSGRLGPIYSHMFEGAPLPAPHGLTMHRLRADSGYRDEVIYTAKRDGMPDYVVRCLVPVEAQLATGGDCQRDIRVGRDLSVLYRFSAAVLKDWYHIDAAISAFVEERLSGGIPGTGGNSL